MMNERRREVLLQRIDAVGKFGSLAGTTVLEIGADRDGIAAQMLLDAGAHRVISTNYGENWPNEAIGSLERRKVDARRLEETLEPQSVDVIFGIAVLEHIDGLAQFFAGAKRVLKPGGLFFVHGGPIWSFARGHHVFVDGETRRYRFGDKQNNPIPDWAHLVHTRSSLAEDLIGRGVPAGDAYKIGAWVYEDSRINRIGFRAMCETFEACALREIDRQINAFKPPPPDLLAAIEDGPFRGQGRYDVSGITFVGRA